MESESPVGAEGGFAASMRRRCRCFKANLIASSCTVAQLYSNGLMPHAVNLPLQDSYQNYSRVNKKRKESTKQNGTDEETIRSPRAQRVWLGRKSSKKPPGANGCFGFGALGGFRKSAQQ